MWHEAWHTALAVAQLSCSPCHSAATLLGQAPTHLLRLRLASSSRLCERRFSRRSRERERRRSLLLDLRRSSRRSRDRSLCLLPL